jgi:hypothetical protein
MAARRAITAGDAAAVTELYIATSGRKVPNGTQIAKLGGIEYFINLQRLDIAFHKSRTWEAVRADADAVPAGLRQRIRT